MSDAGSRRTRTPNVAASSASRAASNAAMPSAIDLDDEAIRRTVEVDDEPDRKRMLTTEARPELTIAQCGPEQCFAASRMLAMKTGEVDEREERRGIVRSVRERIVRLSCVRVA